MTPANIARCDRHYESLRDMEDSPPPSETSESDSALAFSSGHKLVFVGYFQLDIKSEI